MAENSSHVTPNQSEPIVNRSNVTSSGTSKLALLISFVAGAFASWLVITNNIF